MADSGGVAVPTTTTTPFLLWFVLAVESLLVLGILVTLVVLSVYSPFVV